MTPPATGARQPCPGAPIAPAVERCPRCGGGFRCGRQDTAACACAAVQLSGAQRATLRQRYPVGACLCGDCLRAVAGGAAA